jgi:hypothetical protein
MMTDNNRQHNICVGRVTDNDTTHGTAQSATPTSVASTNMRK